jgi:hypothetical protein
MLMIHPARWKLGSCWRLLPFLCLSLVLAGCVRPASTGAVGRSASGQPEISLASVWEALHKGSDEGQCRTVVQILNDYLNRNPEDKPPALSDAERRLLTERFHLDADELAEVENPGFTLLDVHHLTQALLFRDVAVALNLDGLPPADQAAAAFAWVVRQVRLRGLAERPLPPQFVIRRSVGTAEERAAIFFALLEQLGLDGCMVAVPAGGAANAGAVRYWLPGVVIDKQIYLFETRLGLPLPGAKDAGPATLAQVRTHPELLQPLTTDDKHRYDVTADQARKAEPHFVCPLSALAPRMRWLQEKLASQEKVRLGLTPAARLEVLEAATKTPALAGTTVQVWSAPGDLDTPLRVLRSTLPPEEGGTDKMQRRNRAILEMAPWHILPVTLRDMPGEPGRRLQEYFGGPFISVAMDPGMPRDLLLRGHYDRATTRLVQARDEFRRLHREVGAAADADEKLRKWRDQAMSVYANLLRAQREVGPGSLEAVTAAQNEVNTLWKESAGLERMVRARAAEPFLSEATYQLALCQREKAERAQIALERARHAGQAPSETARSTARDAWQSAADWCMTYLEDYPTGPVAAEAQLGRADAVAALGQTAAAVALLQAQADKASGLDRLACLYRIKRLQAQGRSVQ